jgi:hypothetical protein
VCAALQVAFGVRLDVYLLAGQGADTDHQPTDAVPPPRTEDAASRPRW